MFIKRVFSLSVLSILFSAGLFANPDLDFTDSSTYADAYLRHEFNGDDVKFVLTGPILNYRLPNKFYNLEALKSYIQRRVFNNAELKSEFIDMLEMGFSSQFKAKEFLDELVKVLREFDLLNIQ